jgi:hypothetical protein
MVHLAKRLPETVDRLSTASAEQPAIRAQTNALDDTLEKLRERTLQGAKLLTQA